MLYRLRRIRAVRRQLGRDVKARLFYNNNNCQSCPAASGLLQRCAGRSSSFNAGTVHWWIKRAGLRGTPPLSSSFSPPSLPLFFSSFSPKFFPYLPVPPFSLSLPFLSHLNPARGMGSAVSSPSRVHETCHGGNNFALFRVVRMWSGAKTPCSELLG